MPSSGMTCSLDTAAITNGDQTYAGIALLGEGVLHLHSKVIPLDDLINTELHGVQWAAWQVRVDSGLGWHPDHPETRAVWVRH